MPEIILCKLIPFLQFEYYHDLCEVKKFNSFIVIVKFSKMVKIKYSNNYENFLTSCYEFWDNVDWENNINFV